MNMDERIRRINELYHKSQDVGLTDEEKEEQKRLRLEYVASVRGNLKSQLDNISIREKDGSITHLGKKHDKKQLRLELLDKRSSIDENNKKKMDEAILNALINTDDYKKCNIVLTYASYNNEADTFSLIQKSIDDGKKVACPVCGLKNGEPSLDFYFIEGSYDLKSGYRGIPEPAADEKKRVTGDDLKDALMIMPAVGYDKNRNRLGYGKGFYDRFLTGNKVRVTIALAYSCQECDGIPSEKHDHKPDLIINENGVL
ncbi:MAG: 5-formyltetrahydrofolate cyclo-ligase [Lachnospiraceae bacterium]|nr:5-formyltetrahydrofolate cyclo-ligase [Lachnospiraceae bacterium]